MIASLFRTITFLSIICSLACSTQGSRVSDDMLGAYKVSSRSCFGSKAQLQACQAIVFLELIKGNFYNESNREVAFVVWRQGEGNQLIYTEVQYEGAGTAAEYPYEIYLSSGKSTWEVLKFRDENRAEYVFGSQDSGRDGLSRIHLKRTRDDDFLSYQKIYPGSD